MFGPKKKIGRIGTLPQNLAMGPAVRLVRQIQISLLVSMALYVVAGEMLSRAKHLAPASALFHAFSVVSISFVGASVVVRRTLILPSEAVLQQRSDDKLALARWRTGNIVSYALCDALALFGFLLRMTGFTLANVWGFYLGGFLLLLLYSPRQPRPQLPPEEVTQAPK
jgi:hypothetical protein